MYSPIVWYKMRKVILFWDKWRVNARESENIEILHFFVGAVVFTKCAYVCCYIISVYYSHGSSRNDLRTWYYHIIHNYLQICITLYKFCFKKKRFFIVFAYDLT